MDATILLFPSVEILIAMIGNVFLVVRMIMIALLMRVLLSVLAVPVSQEIVPLSNT